MAVSGITFDWFWKVLYQKFYNITCLTNRKNIGEELSLSSVGGWFWLPFLLNITKCWPLTVASVLNCKTWVWPDKSRFYVTCIHNTRCGDGNARALRIKDVYITNKRRKISRADSQLGRVFTFSLRTESNIKKPPPSYLIVHFESF